MTDRPLKMSIGRVLLPEYEQSVPPHDEHEFSQEFERQMRELIAQKTSTRRQKKTREKKTAHVRSARWQPFVSAAAVLVIAFAAVILILSKSEQIDTSHKPSLAPQSSSQSSTDSIGLAQLDFANKAAADMLNNPKKYYAQNYAVIESSESLVTYTSAEAMTRGFESEAAKLLGDCLIYKSIVRYHGSETYAADPADTNKNGYQLLPVSSTVDYTALSSFKDMKGYLTINAKDSENLFSKLEITSINGTGYLRFQVNDHEARTMQQLYFSFTTFDKSFDPGSLITLRSWQTSSAVARHTVDKDVFLAQDGTYVIDPFGNGLKYTIDNSGEMPVVSITQLDISDEQLLDAQIQIHLCKNDEYGSEPIKAATITSSLTKGSFDFAQYSSAISKQQIDGIMIQITYNTTTHPAPASNVYGAQTAYTIEAYYGA